MVLVSTDDICVSIKQVYNDARVVLEPAGALGVAGLSKYAKEHGLKGKTMVAITSGANMDFDRLRFVSEHADVSERMISVTIPEKVRRRAAGRASPLCFVHSPFARFAPLTPSLRSTHSLASLHSLPR